MITKTIGQYLDANVHIYEKNGEVLIIDCGASVNKVKELVGSNKVIGILLTHGHFDHSCYCLEYSKEFGVKIYANENIVKTLSSGDAIYSEDKSTINDFSNFVFLSGDGKIEIGNFIVSYYHSPGHSICCECYLIDGNLFAGDVLFDRSIGRTDLINSDKNQMYDSLCKLENVVFDTVYSGHGDENNYAQQMKNIKVYKRFLTR